MGGFRCSYRALDSKNEKTMLIHFNLRYFLYEF